MSRVVRFHRLGGPEVLQIEEIPDRALKQGELRVRIEAIGLNRAEQMFRAGVYLQTPVLPSLNGCEASAIVMELGPGVSGFSVGEPVSIIPNFSLNDYGVYAEVAVVPAYAVVKRPKGLSAVDAAAVWMAYVTAYGALIDIAKIDKGDAIVITAASSSVGLAAIQIVNSVGAISIATTRTNAKASALKAAGAAHVVVTQEQDLVKSINTITNGKGARIVFDPIGGQGVDKLAQALSPGGHTVPVWRVELGAHHFPSRLSLYERPQSKRVCSIRDPWRQTSPRSSDSLYHKGLGSWGLEAGYRQDLSLRQHCRGPSISGIECAGREDCCHRGLELARIAERMWSAGMATPLPGKAELQT